MNYVQLVTAIQTYTQNFESSFVANIPLFLRQAEKRIYNTVQLPSLRKNVLGSVSLGSEYLSCPSDFLAAYSLAVIDGDGVYHYMLNKDVNYLREAYPNPAVQAFPLCYCIFGPATTSATPPGITTSLTFMVAPTPDAAYDMELHYYYYPESIVQACITSFGTLLGGTQYTGGVYTDVPLTGGTGSGATANIVVAGGVVVELDLTNAGAFYSVGDSLSASAAYIGPGTNFSIAVAGVGNATGTTWLGDNYDPAIFYGALVEAYTFMKGEADMMGYYETKFQSALSQLKRLGDGLERGDAYRDGQAKVQVT